MHTHTKSKMKLIAEVVPKISKWSFLELFMKTLSAVQILGSYHWPPATWDKRPELKVLEHKPEGVGKRLNLLCAGWALVTFLPLVIGGQSREPHTVVHDF